MHIIVGHEKHGTFLYKNAIACVRRRLERGEFEFDPHDKNHAEVARKIIAAADEGDCASAEAAAWNLLQERRDYEYEGVELEHVIT